MTTQEQLKVMRTTSQTVFPYVSKYGQLYQPMVLEKTDVLDSSYWVMVDPNEEIPFESFGWAGSAFLYTHFADENQFWALLGKLGEQAKNLPLAPLPAKRPLK